jgi:peptide deformylase
MAVRDVLLSGDPRLRQPSRAVPPSQCGGEALLALVQDLRDTMAARDGAGLAAPPIAEAVLVNPEVTPLDSELEAGEEGCLSVPGLRAAVPRWCGRWRGFMLGWCRTKAAEQQGLARQVCRRSDQRLSKDP